MNDTNDIQGDTSVNIGGREGAAGLWRDRDAARHLRVDTRTLARWRKRTRDEGRQVGPPWVTLPGGRYGYVRYRPGAVYAWEREQEELAAAI